MKTGFIKAAAVSPSLTAADAGKNLENALAAARELSGEQVQIAVFPELYLTGSTCGDLFFQEKLCSASLNALIRFKNETSDTDTLFCLGLPLRTGGRLFNCAAVIQRGKLLGIVPKLRLQSLGGTDERRWFCPGENAGIHSVRINGEDVPFGKLLFRLSEEAVLGAVPGEELDSPLPPGCEYALAGANILANLSAGCALAGKDAAMQKLLSVRSADCACAYVFASAGVGESTTDFVFSGACSVWENGNRLAQGERFAPEGSEAAAFIDTDMLNAERIRRGFFADGDRSLRKSDFEIIDAPVRELCEDEVLRRFSPLPFLPDDESERAPFCKEVLTIQSAALAKRLMHTRQEKLVLGVSGGLDSALALLVCVRTLRRLGLPAENLLGVSLPGFGTTEKSRKNAAAMVRALGASLLEIDIRPACLQHFKDLGHDAGICNVTYENAQARERTQILMDLGNKHGALLVGTGDMSELALGWCTYNADHMSMYGVNCSVPKTLVRQLVAYEAERLGGEAGGVLEQILKTPVSPELLPPDGNGDTRQRTEDILGPYEVHDFFLYHFLRSGIRPEKLLLMAKRAFEGKYDGERLAGWLRLFIRRFFANQFKRSCLPDGPKVGKAGLSPRGVFQMPSDAEWKEWLEFSG